MRHLILILSMTAACAVDPAPESPDAGASLCDEPAALQQAFYDEHFPCATCASFDCGSDAGLIHVCHSVRKLSDCPNILDQ